MPGVSRALLLLVGVAVLAAALFLALADDLRGALAAALVGAGALLLPTWARAARYPGRHWVALAVIIGGIAVLVSPWLLALVLVLLALKTVFTMRFARGLRSVELEPVPEDVVMPGAEDAVAAFEAEGFRRVGRHRMAMGATGVVSTVLMGPGEDRFALVTDKVWEVTSRFDERWLVTISSGLTPLPRDVLRQEVADGKPPDLVRAHASALEAISATGLRPQRFASDEEVLDAAREIDLRSIRFVAEAGLPLFLRIETRLRPHETALGDDERSRRRVQAWLAAEPVG